MHLLYNIGIWGYGLGLRIASLFNAKAKKWVEGRKALFQDLPNVKDQDVIWFHCASLGEFDQGLPLMNKIKTEHPDVFLLVTFFSPSGMEHYHKRNHKADFVSYIPLDTPKNAKRFIQITRPKSAYFIKYEFWSNHILAAKRLGATVYNVSGLFRPNQPFFKKYGSFFRYTLKQFDWFFVQNKSSEALLHSIGINQVCVTGDSRFDKVADNLEHLKPNTVIDTFCEGKNVFVVGSSWPEDEEIVLPVVNKIDMKVIIAPHNIDAKHVKGITSELKRPFSTYTNPKNLQESEVLILDSIGQLSGAYSHGAVAYVGGGFSGSLHNILEPAVFGMGVIFGPKHNRFPEAQHFIDNGFGFSVSTKIELENVLRLICDNKECIDDKAKEFVQQNRGASNQIYNRIFNSNSTS